MTKEMQLHYFTKNNEFPFFIQYGHHEEDMFLHRHADFSELVFILNGTATHIVNSAEYAIKKGDVFVINKNTSHGYQNTHHFRLCNIMYQPEFFLEKLGDIKSLPGYHSLFVIEPAMTQQHGFQAHLSLSQTSFAEFEQQILQLHQEYTSHRPGFQTMITGLFLQIITNLSRLSNGYQPEPHDSTISLANSVAFMEYHFREPLTIEELAGKAGMSTRHFRRIFQDIYGTSPLKYLNTLRIQAAARLLRSTELPVTEIAIRCGWSDGNYFSSKFKQSTGQSPLEYRKS